MCGGNPALQEDADLGMSLVTRSNLGTRGCILMGGGFAGLLDQKMMESLRRVWNEDVLSCLNA